MDTGQGKCGDHVCASDSGGGIQPHVAPRASHTHTATCIHNKRPKRTTHMYGCMYGPYPPSTHSHPQAWLHSLTTRPIPHQPARRTLSLNVAAMKSP